MTNETEQQMPPKAEPQQEHAWLQQLVGEWTFEGEATMAPGQPPHRFKGTTRVRPLGGLWIMMEGHGQMPDGTPVTTMLTLGYDSQRKRFVGTWVDSLMTHMWVYDGALDAAGKVLTLDTEGPGMAGDGKTAKFREIIEVHNDEHHVLSSQTLGEDGAWHRFMTARYRRKL